MKLDWQLHVNWNTHTIKKRFLLKIELIPPLFIPCFPAWIYNLFSLVSIFHVTSVIEKWKSNAAVMDRQYGGLKVNKIYPEQRQACALPTWADECDCGDTEESDIYNARCREKPGCHSGTAVIKRWEIHKPSVSVVRCQYKHRPLWMWCHANLPSGKEEEERKVWTQLALKFFEQIVISYASL